MSRSTTALIIFLPRKTNAKEATPKEQQVFWAFAILLVAVTAFIVWKMLKKVW